MQNIVEVEKEEKYGRDLIYPLNDTAKLACELAGNQKTLTVANIETLKRMGFVVKQVAHISGKRIEVGDL